MEIAIIALVLLVLGAPAVIYLRGIAHALRIRNAAVAPATASEPKTAPEAKGDAEKAEPAKDEDDDDDESGDDLPIIAKLKKRGFVCWVDEDPPPGRVGVGDMRFELSSDYDDPDVPHLFCPTCANPMHDFEEALEPKTGKDGPRWAEHGSVCLSCGFYFEDEDSGSPGFFGPLIEECYDFNEIFELLEKEDVAEQRKLLARREAAAMRQLLVIRSQRRALERGPKKEKPADVHPLLPPAPPKTDDPH